MKDRLRWRARELGFELFGVAAAEPLDPEGERLRRWLAEGKAGWMEWIGRTFEKRVDPSKVLPGVRSVVCVGMNYNRPNRCKGRLHVAKYAQGEDYHRVLRPKLEALCEWLAEMDPQSRSVWYVDTGPVMEKAWAQRAGLGWIGKHTNLIHPDGGSWYFLGVILTTLDLESDAPESDRCSTCTLCVDACPTGALDEPYRLDATQCISYLTIEHRGEMDEESARRLSGYIFGCDICQDVCPWNRHAEETAEAAFLQDPLPWSDTALLAIEPDSFRRIFARSAVRRTRWEGLTRNIGEVLRNAGGRRSGAMGGDGVPPTRVSRPSPSASRSSRSAV